VWFWCYFRLAVISTTARVVGFGWLWLMSGCELGRKVVRVSKQWIKSKARLPCATNVTVPWSLSFSTCIITVHQIGTCTTYHHPTNTSLKEHPSATYPRVALLHRGRVTSPSGL
jgi:hypothetical protein